MRMRAVIVHRPSELDELLDRHSTRGQVEFFLRTRGRTLSEVQEYHDLHEEALNVMRLAVPQGWARTEVERDSLSRFLFAPEDVIVVVGQDGLVANVAKYIDGQPVIGVDSAPGRNPGVLVSCAPAGAASALRDIDAGREPIAERLTMVRAEVDDTRSITALNEVFIGHASHQSARYRISEGTAGEDQSSSGIVVSTGTGATGWGASLVRGRAMGPLPGRAERSLAWFVREAWPSPRTGVSMTEGILDAEGALEITVASDRLVVFGDGIEADRCEASWGQRIRVSVAEKTLRLVRT